MTMQSMYQVGKSLGYEWGIGIGWHSPKTGVPRETRDYAEFQVFWIDEDKKLLIDDARKNGRKLDAQFGVRVYEKHRINL